MADKNQNPLVSIICLTYNHAPYIRECLNGFLMQKVDFPFEIIIHDDASTDGTTEIILEYATKYPNIIKPIIQKENQYSKHHNFGKIMSICFDMANGEYLAYCEGDDYWIDECKLEKQIDFLRKNPNYGLVHTDVYIADYKKKFKLEIKNKPYVPEGDVYSEILKNNFISTLTVVFHKKLVKYLYSEVSPIPFWDRIMWICLSRHTKFHYIPDRTSVYRILENSATHGDYHLVLETETMGTKDLLEFLKRNNISQQDINSFYIPRAKKLLRLSYLAKDRGATLKYWNEIKQNEHLQIKDYIIYILGKFHIPKIIYNSLIKFRKFCKIQYYD